MKTFVILGAFIALAQATTPSATFQENSAKAFEDCVQEKSLDPKHIGEILKNSILPEDNPEFTDFFLCYWTKLGIIKADGTFNEEVIKTLTPAFLKEKFPDIADHEKLAGEVIEHCKDTPKTESVGVTGIKYRNCVIEYAQKHQ